MKKLTSLIMSLLIVLQAGVFIRAEEQNNDPIIYENPSLKSSSQVLTKKISTPAKMFVGGLIAGTVALLAGCMYLIVDSQKVKPKPSDENDIIKKNLAEENKTDLIYLSDEKLINIVGELEKIISENSGKSDPLSKLKVLEAEKQLRKVQEVQAKKCGKSSSYNPNDPNEKPTTNPLSSTPSTTVPNDESNPSHNPASINPGKEDNPNNSSSVNPGKEDKPCDSSSSSTNSTKSTQGNTNNQPGGTKILNLNESTPGCEKIIIYNDPKRIKVNAPKSVEVIYKEFKDIPQMYTQVVCIGDFKKINEDSNFKYKRILAVPIDDDRISIIGEIISNWENFNNENCLFSIRNQISIMIDNVPCELFQTSCGKDYYEYFTYYSKLYDMNNVPSKADCGSSVTFCGGILTFVLPEFSLTSKDEKIKSLCSHIKRSTPVDGNQECKEMILYASYLQKVLLNIGNIEVEPWKGFSPNTAELPKTINVRQRLFDKTIMTDDYHTYIMLRYMNDPKKPLVPKSIRVNDNMDYNYLNYIFKNMISSFIDRVPDKILFSFNKNSNFLEPWILGFITSNNTVIPIGSSSKKFFFDKELLNSSYETQKKIFSNNHLNTIEITGLCFSQGQNTLDLEAKLSNFTGIVVNVFGSDHYFEFSKKYNTFMEFLLDCCESYFKIKKNVLKNLNYIKKCVDGNFIDVSSSEKKEFYDKLDNPKDTSIEKIRIKGCVFDGKLESENKNLEIIDLGNILSEKTE